MDRRAFIVGSVAAFSSARAARAEVKLYRIGYLSPNNPKTFGVDVFRQALNDLGWVEGRNVSIDYRSADGRFDRLPRLAVELVSLKPDVIVAVATVSALAAKKTTQSIPIVFTYVSEPVASGLVDTLARPTANITGVAHHNNASLNPKRLEILRNAVPNATHIVGLWQPGGLGDFTDRLMLKQTDAAAAALGFRVQLVEARVPADLDGVFATAVRERPEALFVLPGPVFRSNAQRVVELVAKAQLPAMYFGREFPKAGGLMSYGADLTDIVKSAAAYVDRLLKGARPADLPVEQSAKFELVINLKSATALGLTIPPALLLRADQLIE